MRLFLEFIITVAVVFVLLKIGWPAPLLIAPLYAFAFSLKWPFLSRRTNLDNRFLAFLWFYLLIAGGVAWFVAEALFLPQVQQDYIADSAVLTFLTGSMSLKVFWSIIVGLLSATLIAALFLVPYGRTAAPHLYSQHEQYRGHEGEATASAIGALLHMGSGMIVVNNGKAEPHGEGGGALDRFGGPGTIIVQEGHAVILEKSGRLSRVCGRGITFLEPFERISMVVPLFTRGEKLSISQVATKDRVVVEEIEILVFHKLDPGPEEGRIQDGLFAYNKDVLLDKVWNPSNSDWQGALRSISETATRDVVGRYDLEDIYPISDAFRVAFKAELMEQINTVTTRLLNVRVSTVDINRVRIPTEAQKRLWDKWMADWDIQVAGSERQATILRGEADAVLMKVKEVAWAEAQREIIQRVTEGFRDVGLDQNGQVAYVIALRALETLEKMAGDPATKILLPNDMLMQLRDLRQVVATGTPPGGNGALQPRLTD